mgnify:CR=1 FL=1
MVAYALLLLSTFDGVVQARVPTEVLFTALVGLFGPKVWQTASKDSNTVKKQTLSIRNIDANLLRRKFEQFS